GQVGRRGRAHPHREERRLPARSRRLRVGALLLFLRRRIALKLTLTLVVFTAIAGLAAALYLNRALKAFAVESLEVRLAAIERVLHDDARDLLARPVPEAARQAFAQKASRATGARVTVILPGGRVVAESETPSGGLAGMENHAERPEVRAALAGRLGRDPRTSSTLETPLLYVASPVRDGDRLVGVLRLALPLAEVTASHENVHRVMLVGGLLALTVALGIGLFVSGRGTRPGVEAQCLA